MTDELSMKTPGASKRPFSDLTPNSDKASPTEKVHITDFSHCDLPKMADISAPEWFLQYTKSLDTKLDVLQKGVKEIEDGMKECLDVAHAAKVIANDAKEIAKESREASDELFDRVSKMESEIASLKGELKANKRHSVALDDYSRRSNLIIDGINESHDEEISALIEKVRKVFTLLKLENPENIKLERCHRINRFMKQGPKPVIVRFNSYYDRDQCWKKRSNLKGSNIWVNEDFSLDITKFRITAWPIVKATKAAGHKCVVKGDWIIIDGKMHTIDTLPQHLQLESLSNKTDENVQAFFGKHSKLSNFHPAPFEVDSVKFNCNEQFYHYSKAVHFNDMSTADKILKEKVPGKQKSLGEQVKGFSNVEWEPISTDIMLKGLVCKFSQNTELLRSLVLTGNKLLAEASVKDLFWGTGVSLTSPNCLNPETYTGTNHLGKLLMSVREHCSEKLTPSVPM